MAKIIGNTTATPMAIPDWNQTDKNKADYIKNKPSLEGLATEDYVDTKIAEMVNSAPETLDTLNELANALGDNPNFATTMATQLGNKVNKQEGKGLSTNDFTTEEKEKLKNISDGAQVNVNADWNQTDETKADYIKNKPETTTVIDENSNDQQYVTAKAVYDYITNNAVGGKGENGATFTPSVSDEGVISWTNDKGLDNPTPINIKGERGPQGDTYVLTDTDRQEIASIVESDFESILDELHAYAQTILGE